MEKYIEANIKSKHISHVLFQNSEDVATSKKLIEPYLNKIDFSEIRIPLSDSKVIQYLLDIFYRIWEQLPFRVLHSNSDVLLYNVFFSSISSSLCTIAELFFSDYFLKPEYINQYSFTCTDDMLSMFSPTSLSHQTEKLYSPILSGTDNILKNGYSYLMPKDQINTRGTQNFPRLLNILTNANQVDSKYDCLLSAMNYPYLEGLTYFPFISYGIYSCILKNPKIFLSRSDYMNFNKKSKSGLVSFIDAIQELSSSTNNNPEESIEKYLIAYRNAYNTILDTISSLSFPPLVALLKIQALDILKPFDILNACNEKITLQPLENHSLGSLSPSIWISPYFHKNQSELHPNVFRYCDIINFIQVLFFFALLQEKSKRNNNPADSLSNILNMLIYAFDNMGNIFNHTLNIYKPKHMNYILSQVENKSLGMTSAQKIYFCNRLYANHCLQNNITFIRMNFEDGIDLIL